MIASKPGSVFAGVSAAAAVSFTGGTVTVSLAAGVLTGVPTGVPMPGVGVAQRLL
jgi:hypothetical protein